MANLSPITQKQARVIVSALPGVFWTSISGGKYSHEEVKYNDGNAGLTKTYFGMAEIEPITVKKPYDPVNDGAIQAFASAQRSSKTPFNVTVQPVNADVAGSNLAGAKAITYENCTFLSYTPPQFDRDGSGLAMVEMTFAVNSLPSY